MKLKEIVSWIMLFLMAILFIPHGGWGQPKEGTKAPLIIHSYAVEGGQYGHIWKIYIEAEDPDGDMFKIASVVDQAGYGHYPTHFSILKPHYRKHLKGYLQWNTFSTNAPFLREWTQIVLRVSIFDKAGNESNEILFPFTFETGVKSISGVPAPFDERDLPKIGNIHIDLFEPTLMGNGPRDN